MRKSDALALAAQLNVTLPKTKCADALYDHCQTSGLMLAVDNETGAWVVLRGDEVIARLN